MIENNTENKMGTMPVGKLLVQISLPMMISMLVQALYNIVDSIFVAQISENALTAVSLAFPIQNLMISTSVGTGVGVNALLSKGLGEKDYERSDNAANMGLLLTLFHFILFLVLVISEDTHLISKLLTPTQYKENTFPTVQVLSPFISLKLSTISEFFVSIEKSLK